MSDGSRPRPEEIARFLRQRRELGGGELFLERLSRDDVLRSVRDARRRTVASASSGGPDAGASGSEPSTGSSRPGDSQRPPDSSRSDGDGDRPDDPRTLPADARRFRSGDSGPEALASLEHDAVERVASRCRRCGLAGERRQVVFFDGHPRGRLMVVGEAPGAREDEQGLPFVGPAGKMLDLLLASVDLSREESVYICNVIKCRPPGNRNPRPDEIDACAPFLRRQIELVEPEAILAVGTFAGRLLTGRSSTLGKLRGEVYSYEGVPLVVTYHPAALLRNRSWTRSTWDDLQLLRDVLDGTR